MKMLPAVGGMKPVTMRMVVDLPAPFGPRKPSTSPRSTAKVRSFTATFAPNAFVRFSTLITAFLLRSSEARSFAPRYALRQKLQPALLAGHRHIDPGFAAGRHQARNGP